MPEDWWHAHVASAALHAGPNISHCLKTKFVIAIKVFICAKQAVILMLPDLDILGPRIYKSDCPSET
jgi:hypothetical protein